MKFDSSLFDKKLDRCIELFAANPLSGEGHLIAVGSSLLIVGSFFWVPAIAWYVWRKKCNTRRKKMLAFAILVGLFTLPMPRYSRVHHFSIWKSWYSYFKVRVVGAAKLDATKQYIFAVTPHGVFPFSLACIGIGKINQEIFNKARVVVASSVQRFPVIGHLLQMIGAVNASKNSVKEALQKGDSLALCPGGIGEMFWGYPRPGCLPSQEYALLKSRKGMIELALQHGASLVPVYAFGGSKLFKKAYSPIVEKISRLFGVSILLFWGRLGLPVPFTVPLLYAVGEPIQVQQTLNPTPQEIDQLHEKFCQALLTVFNR